ncbi:MAG: hypothetical protein PVF91_09265 [Chromatiales bacterium]
MTDRADSPSASCPDRTGIPREEAWIAAIHKTDETRADPVRRQMELEEKSSALGEASRFIVSVQAATTATPWAGGPGPFLRHGNYPLGREG